MLGVRFFPFPSSKLLNMWGYISSAMKKMKFGFSGSTVFELHPESDSTRIMIKLLIIRFISLYFVIKHSRIISDLNFKGHQK